MVQLLEKLQLQPRDHDNCTIILEMERIVARAHRYSHVNQRCRKFDISAGAKRYISGNGATPPANPMRNRRTSVRHDTEIGGASDIETAAAELVNFFRVANLRALPVTDDG
jgi:hypothetical protein